jgi:hypothetical protein
MLSKINQKALMACQYLRVSLRRVILMNTSIPYCRTGVLFYLATMAVVCGQVESSSQPTQQAAPSPVTEQVSQSQATLQAFQQEQQTFGPEF